MRPEWRRAGGLPGRAAILALASRPEGVLVPELQERLGLAWAICWRAIARLIQERAIIRTGARRRRPDVWGPRARGAGGYVYWTALGLRRARRQEAPAGRPAANSETPLDGQSASPV